MAPPIDQILAAAASMVGVHEGSVRGTPNDVCWDAIGRPDMADAQAPYCAAFAVWAYQQAGIDLQGLFSAPFASDQLALEAQARGWVSQTPVPGCIFTKAKQEEIATWGSPAAASYHTGLYVGMSPDGAYAVSIEGNSFENPQWYLDNGIPQMFGIDPARVAQQAGADSGGGDGEGDGVVLRSFPLDGSDGKAYTFIVLPEVAAAAGMPVNVGPAAPATTPSMVMQAAAGPAAAPAPRGEAPSVSPDGSPHLTVGHEDGSVGWLGDQLRAIGYAVPVGNFYTWEHAQAIAAIQQQHGYAGSGECGPSTWQLINAILTGQPIPPPPAFPDAPAPKDGQPAPAAPTPAAPAAPAAPAPTQAMPVTPGLTTNAPASQAAVSPAPVPARPTPASPAGTTASSPSPQPAPSGKGVLETLQSEVAVLKQEVADLRTAIKAISDALSKVKL